MLERVKMIRELYGESQRAFAERIGVKQQTYSNYESGRADVPDDLKRKLAEMGINIHWLVTGNGPMMLDGEDAPASVPVVSKGTYISASGKLTSQEIPDGGLSVPIVTQKLSAGWGQDWTQDDIMSGLRFPMLAKMVSGFPIDRIYAAEVRGDSMAGVYIFDGDIVAFARGVVDGDGIYVIAVDNEVYVKRLHFNPFDKTVTIKSENEKYDPITVDADRVNIMGKVVSWYHRHLY